MNHCVTGRKNETNFSVALQTKWFSRAGAILGVCMLVSSVLAAPPLDFQRDDYQFNQSLAPLEPLRQDLSILGVLSHPHGRKMGGHNTSDIFLTGVELTGSQLRNSVSMDQLAATHFENQTRFSSMVLSTEGGVGEATRATTLSFSRTVQPIPALHQPRMIIERLIGIDSSSKATQLSQLRHSSSMLDLIAENTRSMRRRLGTEDQTKLDDYLDSVRQIEQRLERSQQWLDVPKPQVDSDGLHLEATANTPVEFVRTMYDLIVLAFQTDSTRLATFQLASMSGGIANKFPILLGFEDEMHKLAHQLNKPGGALALGRWDKFLTEQFVYLLNRLKEIPEGDGTLLDHTLVLYGSSNSRTHENSNYPLIVAGGQAMGFRHGSYHRFSEDVPFANFHLTALNQLGVPVETFADSNGMLSELIS